MELEGGCYCKSLRYKAKGDPIFKGQCHCRECQYFSGGHPNPVMAMPDPEFTYTKGKPRQFTRRDLKAPVTREFCGECGTQILARAPGLPGHVILKVGTLDNPAEFGGPMMAIHLADKQSFHHVPTDVPGFDRLPG